VIAGAVALLVAMGAGGLAGRTRPLDPRVRFTGFTETCAGVPGALPDRYVHDYGPLSDAEKRGMCTWYFWPGGDPLSGKGPNAEGNPLFWRRAETLTARIARTSGLPITVNLLAFIDSNRRNRRFKELGLINDPDCRKAGKPDAFGLWIDECKDPHSSGILGLRIYPNHRFDARRWNAREFFEEPAMQPPYVVGLTCGLCHISFNPVRPPLDPERPEWKDLVGAIGNQYLREGQMFKGKLREDDFLYQIYETQEPGTSDTSRLSTDFINNPNSVNPIFFLASKRPPHKQVMNDGTEAEVPNVLKDGADSIGAAAAALRVYVNIGTCGDYRMGLEDTFVGLKAQTPFDLRKAEAECEDWRLTRQRVADVAAFLSSSSNSGYRLDLAPGGSSFLTTDREKLSLGARLFGENCARCHSSKLPPGLTAETKHDPAAKPAWASFVSRDDFLEGNFLSDDTRYPLVSPDWRFAIGTNAARALATNATEGHIWQDFSSRTYKTSSSPGILTLYNPFDPAYPIDFPIPATGIGYYRTPSLIGIWATAPFLHNNSVGRYTGDPSVKGRVDAFIDAAEKLLWPEKRLGVQSIKRTTRTTYLQWHDARVEIPPGTPVNLLANIDLRAAGVVTGLDDALKEAARNPADVRSAARALLRYNQCPDFIEDHGHPFGSRLGDAEKWALIGYIERF
jgi:hypothetical protein